MCSFGAIMFKGYIILFISILTCPVLVFGQSKKIQIINSNSFEIGSINNQQVKKLIGDVHLMQDNTIMKCDSAYLFDNTNYVEAYRNVKIIQNDTTVFAGDFLKYDGQNKLAKLSGNVSMTEPNSKLICDMLDFDMRLNTVSYKNNGKFVSNQTELKSVQGIYFLNTKEMAFKNDVRLVNTEMQLFTDTLIYRTSQKEATFLGYTTIITNDDTITCNAGWYNTNKQNGLLRKDVFVKNKDVKMKADSVFYNRLQRHTKSFGNITVVDATNKYVLQGGVAESFVDSKKSYVTRQAVIFSIEGNDTMSIKADSIWLYQKNKLVNNDFIRAYRRVKIFKNDLQAICDSLVHNNADSVTNLFGHPVLWSGDNQITGDTMSFYFKQKQIDSVFVANNAFVASKETKLYYNQIKGKYLSAKFVNQKINYLTVLSNSQSIYFAKEKEEYIGVNVVDCSEMKFTFSEGKITSTKFLNKPDAVFYPINELKPDELKLRGFTWSHKLKPKRQVIR